MELYTFSTFENIASYFTARDIADVHCFKTYNYNEIAEDGPNMTTNIGGSTREQPEIVLIEKEDKIIGISTPEGYVESVRFSEDDEVLSTWGDVLEPISPSMIISSNTSLLDLIEMFNSNDEFLIVLDKNELVGIISFYDLDCNEMKISIMSLIFELDNLLIKMIHNSKLNVRDILSKKVNIRISKFSKEDKYKDYRDIIFYLNFRDKFALMNKIFQLQDFTKKELKKFIDTLQCVRNKIAHGESIIGNMWFDEIKLHIANSYKYSTGKIITEKILSDPKKFKYFINNLRSVISQIRLKVEN
jgi:CBS domain-containing protein